MPWKESCIVDQRLQFLSSYQKEEMSVSELCRIPSRPAWPGAHSPVPGHAFRQAEVQPQHGYPAHWAPAVPGSLDAFVAGGLLLRVSSDECSAVLAMFQSLKRGVNASNWFSAHGQPPSIRMTVDDVPKVENLGSISSVFWSIQLSQWILIRKKRQTRCFHCPRLEN
jgi:hypothetical protein